MFLILEDKTDVMTLDTPCVSGLVLVLV